MSTSLTKWDSSQVQQCICTIDTVSCSSLKGTRNQSRVPISPFTIGTAAISRLKMYSHTTVLQVICSSTLCTANLSLCTDARTRSSRNETKKIMKC